jgi:hypothetical protein
VVVQPRLAPLIAALFVLFIPLAFSEDIIEFGYDLAREAQPPWVTILADMGLMSLLALLGLGIWRVRWHLLALGVASMLFIDAIVESHGTDEIWFLVLTALAYAISLAVLAAAFVGDQFRPVVPLLIGTVAAYIATIAFSTDIGKEYFEQVSQVIPLLLIAVGFEAKHFQRYADQAVGKAVIIVTVTTLCFAEVMALTALPLAGKETVNMVASWHRYAAFVITIEACFVTLATLAWALITYRETSPSQAPPFPPACPPPAADPPAPACPPPAVAPPPPAAAPAGQADVGATVLATLGAFAAGVALAQALRRRGGS